MPEASKWGGVSAAEFDRLAYVVADEHGKPQGQVKEVRGALSD